MYHLWPEGQGNTYAIKQARKSYQVSLQEHSQTRATKSSLCYFYM